MDSQCLKRKVGTNAPGLVSGKERILCHPYALGLTDTEQMVLPWTRKETL